MLARYGSLTVIGISLVMTSALAGVESLPRSTPDAVGLSSAKLSQATDLLRRAAAEQKIAGAVAGVARRGKLVYLEAVGFRDLAARAPMAETSMCRIYSMTKPITATAVMMLYE